MKHKLWFFVFLLFVPKVQAQIAPAPSLMNFQGRLAKPDGTPLPDGMHQVAFSFWSAATGGTQLWSQNFPSLAVRNGAFAALLNVGTGPANLFSNNLFLQIQADTSPALTPRQQLVTVAYAFKANTVPDGSIGATQLSSSAFFNATSFNLWSTLGNSGTNAVTNFLGTTDNQALLFKTNNTRSLGLYPTNSATGSIFRSTNLIGGSDTNLMDAGVAGATIAGGGYFNTSNNGIFRNAVYDNFCTISGGAGNFCGSNDFNVTDATYATIGGGYNNVANAQFTVIGGGSQNDAFGQYSVVAGGSLNGTSGQYATVSGGGGCTAGSDNSTVGGGFSNYATAIDATVGGGIGNGATALGATVSGGFSNTAGGSYASVGGGIGNSAAGLYGTIPGGLACAAQGDFSFAAGNSAKAMNKGAFVWADSANGNFTSAADNSFIIRAAGGVGINTNNPGAFALNVTGNGNFSGTVTSQGVLLLSDARYKTNIQPLDDALDSVLQLRGVTYDWRRSAFPDKNFPAGRQVGFIAQEVEKVLPELVHKDANGYYSVAYASAVPLLVEAVKQQQRQINTLKEQNARITSDNMELRRQAAHIAQLEKQMAALLAASQPKKAAQVAHNRP